MVWVIMVQRRGQPFRGDFLMWMRGPVFGRCRTRQMDLLKIFERDVRGTEGKCDMLFWFGWMGGLLEVRVPEWGDADESVVIGVNAHVTSSLGNMTYFVEILPTTSLPASRHGTHDSLPIVPCYVFFADELLLSGSIDARKGGWQRKLSPTPASRPSVPQKMADESKSSPTVDMGNFTTAAQPEPLTGIN
ncbi:hypothetical protein BGY98DRAFT_937153 [Russula aff. rugulosa BPL654]|nr:hypothetical protein BGY98DRAFT_937153 [Russula aff. rugulosa BPL654]